MRLATIRHENGTRAVRIDTPTQTPSVADAPVQATVIDGFADLSQLLADPQWQDKAANAAGREVTVSGTDYAPLVPNPGKVVCVGLNYANHIQEMGRELPEYPTLFTKFADALTGPYDDVAVPGYASEKLDWEAELAVIVGRDAYQVAAADAPSYIAGYSVINDYTMRDFQKRTLQWDQGKTFQKASGFGPHLVTEYELGGAIETLLDGQTMQSSTTDQLVFTPTKLIEYISHIITLRPGDVICTGTPGGVGNARKPPRYIQDGETVEIRIEGIGAISNTTRIR